MNRPNSHIGVVATIVAILLCCSACSATPSKPRARDARELGINILWYDDATNSDAIVALKAQRIFDYTVKLNANAVEISFPFYQNTHSSSTVEIGPSTPSVRRLGIVIREAKRQNLRVTLRPLMDETRFDPSLGQWRGNIRPTNRARWFKSYWRVIAPYLQLARKSRVQGFVIGAELTSLEGDPHWKQIAKRARRSFKGRIDYSANWDRIGMTKTQFGIPARIGFDAYFPVNTPDNASVSRLVKGWNYWLRQAPPETNFSQLVFHEVGAPANTGFFSAPWEVHYERPLAPALQARWFKAVCRIFTARRMQGIYWWKLDFHTDPKQPDLSDRGSFVGRPAEKVIKSCFASR